MLGMYIKVQHRVKDNSTEMGAFCSNCNQPEAAQIGSTWKNDYNESDPCAGRRGLEWVHNHLCARCLSGCLCECAQEINVIMDVSVENSNSILEFKMLLIPFHN